MRFPLYICTLTTQYFNYFVIISLYFHCTAIYALLDIQQITVYSENCCKGRNETFSTVIRNLEDVSAIVTKGSLKSFSTDSGLWVLSPETNFSEIGIFREAPEKRSDETESILGSCSSTARGNGYTQYKSIRYIGNNFINLPGLSFYTKVNFFGEELYFDGTLLKLPIVYQFKSFGFTAKPNWTIFNDLNYTGNATCLKSHQAKPITAVTHKSDHHGSAKDAEINDKYAENNTLFFVGSIRRHCPRPAEAKREKQPKHIQQHLRHHINILTLHTKPSQRGLELMTDAYEVRLPSTHTFKSYSFIGHKNWTVYNGLNFDGPSRCLFNPKSTLKSTIAKFNGSGIHQSIDLAVGSLKRGCETDPVKEVISPPPKPTTTQEQTGGTTTGFRIRKVAMLILNVSVIAITSHLIT